MADSALAVQQAASTLRTILPNDMCVPLAEERALCVSAFYTQGKIVGTRGSILSALLAHAHMARVDELIAMLSTLGITGESVNHKPERATPSSRDEWGRKLNDQHVVLH